MRISGRLSRSIRLQWLSSLIRGPRQEPDVSRRFQPGMPSLKGVGTHQELRLRRDAPRPRLNNVSMELYPGQVALLMGPSGSGKSTLLAVLSGLMRPDEGRVLSHDQDLWAMTEVERGNSSASRTACLLHLPGIQSLPGPDRPPAARADAAMGQGDLSGQGRRGNARARCSPCSACRRRPICGRFKCRAAKKQRVAIGRAAGEGAVVPVLRQERDRGPRLEAWRAGDRSAATQPLADAGGGRAGGRP